MQVSAKLSVHVRYIVCLWLNNQTVLSKHDGLH